VTLAAGGAPTGLDDHHQDDPGDAGVAAVGRDAGEVRAAIAELTGWLADAAAPGRVAVAARRLRDEGLAPSLQIDEPLPWVSDGGGGANVPLTALALQLRYLRTSARLSYAAVRWLLSEAMGEDPVPWAGVVESRCGTEEDPGYAVAAVNATAALLVLACRPDATRQITAPPHPSPVRSASGVRTGNPTGGVRPATAARLSGWAHAVRVEEAVQQAVAELGADTFAGTLRRIPVPASLVAAATIERCRLSRRLVEGVLPAMTARLRPGIRRELLALHADELARLAQEEEACRAIGVDARRIEQHLPLPWFQVFVDAHLAVAQADIGSFLASVMLTEPWPGDRVGIRRRFPLADPPAGAEPVSSRARALLSEVPSVSAFRHRSVIESVILLAEVAERAWRLLLDLHTDHRAGRWLPPAYHRRSLPGVSGAGHP
jgi:hypothetical protein